MERTRETRPAISGKADRRLYALVLLYVAFRAILASGREVHDWLAARPEIGVPMSTLKEHLETAFLMRHGVPVYSEGPTCQPMPLIALLLDWLTRWRLAEAFFVLSDIAGSFCLYLTLCKQASIDSSIPVDPVYTFGLYTQGGSSSSALFNPLSMISSIALNSQQLAANAILVAIYFAHSNKAALTGFAVAVASYVSLYPLLLVIPLSILLSSGRIAAFALFWFVGLFKISAEVVGNYGFLRAFLCHLNVASGKPNLGLSWYLFNEIFDHFRPLFIYVFQLLVAVHIPAMSIKFGALHVPYIGVYLALCTVSIFKPYPNAADYGLMASSGALLGSITHSLSPKLIVLVVNLVPFIAAMAHLQWRFWQHLGSGNANFYFSTCLVWNGMLIWWALHVAWSARRMCIERDNERLIAESGNDYELHLD